MPRRQAARFPFFFLPRREFGTLVGNRAWSGVSSTPQRLKGKLGPFLSKALGRDFAPSELPEEFRRRAAEDPEGFEGLVSESTDPAVEEAAAEWKKLDQTERESYVGYTTDAPESGHLRQIVTVQRLPNAKQQLARPSLFRKILAAFPAYFAALTPEQRASFLSFERDIDGSPVSPLPPLWESIAEHNADLLRRERPLDGAHLVGWENIIQITLHVVKERAGRSSQTVLALTDVQHALDGTAVRRVVEVPGEKDVVAFTNIHAGRHPISLGINFGDAVNALVVPNLENVLARRGTLLAEHFDELRHELGPRADRLLLDGKTIARFNEICAQQSWRLNFDTALLAVSDAMAVVLRFLRAFNPSTAVVTSAADLGRVESADQLEDLVKKGAEEAYKLGSRLDKEYAAIGEGVNGAELDIAALDKSSKDLAQRRGRLEEERQRNDEDERRAAEQHRAEDVRRLQEERARLESEERRVEEEQRRAEEERRRLEKERQRREEEVRRRHDRVGV